MFILVAGSDKTKEGRRKEGSVGKGKIRCKKIPKNKERESVLWGIIRGREAQAQAQDQVTTQDQVTKKM